MIFYIIWILFEMIGTVVLLLLQYKINNNFLLKV